MRAKRASDKIGQMLYCIEVQHIGGMTHQAITQGELSTLLYMLETSEIPEAQTCFAKLEALADRTPDPNDLNAEVLTIANCERSEQ